jgi:capsular exopolysaccharide synthesis family protein
MNSLPSPRPIDALARQTTTLAIPPGPMDFGGQPHAQQTNILKVIHGLFRGRYLLTGILAAIGFLGGVALGWMSKKPEFLSEAWVRVQPTVINVTNLRNDQMTNFQGFVGTQIEYLRQQKTMDAAMNSAEWIGLGLGTDTRAQQDFKSRLAVRSPTREAPEIIRLSFSHADPKVAFTGVTQVARAYETLFAQGQGRALVDARIAIHETDIARMEGEIRSRRARMEQLASEIGTFNPQDASTSLLMQEMRLQDQLDGIEERLRAMGVDLVVSDGTGGGGAGPGSETPAKPGPEARKPEEMSYEEIARTDEDMAALVARYRENKSQLDELTVTLGDQHRDVRKLRGAENRLKGLMEDRKQVWLGIRPAEATPDLRGLNLESPSQLKRRREDIMAQLRDLRTRASEIARKAQEWQNLRREIDDLRVRVAQVQETQNSIRQNAQIQEEAGQIQITYPERPPAWPSNDSRKKFAAVFGFLGFAIPVMAIGIYGLADRRYRYSDEAIEEGPQNAPLLGILPRLPSDLSDTEQAAAAAHCVHQIRALVQIGGKHRKTIAVTSSNPGDGKTSLALALALSYASSGSKTLLLDLDLIGQGLSRSMRMREQDSLFHVLSRGTVGDILARVKPTHMDRLYILPTGVEDDHRTANRLSEPLVHKVLDAVRDEFDVVIIDTGPVMGSIEAHLVCAQADGVILVVGAGRARGQVKAAADQLKRVGASVLGLVFNLAQARDFRTSAASQSFRSVRPDAPPTPKAQPTDFPELEPLPRVVALDTKR